MNVAVTGYVGTGSSAMIDLLREYDGVKIVPEERASYEHQVFYTKSRSVVISLMYSLSSYGAKLLISADLNNRS